MAPAALSGFWRGAASASGLAASSAVARAVRLSWAFLAARWLEQTEFGTLVYLLALLSIAQVAVDSGIDVVFIQRVGSEPDRASRLVQAAWILKLAGSLVIGVVCVGLGVAGDLPWIAVAALFLLTLLGGLFNCFSSYRQALIHYGAVARANAARAGTLIALLAGTALLGRATLESMLAVLLLSEAIGVAVLLPKEIARGWPSSSQLLFIGRPAMVIGLGTLASIASTRLPTLALAHFGDNVELALFGAASRIVEASQLVPSLVTLVTFPVMCAIVGSGAVGLDVTSERTAVVSALVGIGLTSLFSAATPAVILAIYGSRYAGSQPLFAMLVNILPLTFLNPVLTSVLYAQNQGHKMMRITIANLVTTALLVLLLVPPFGTVGAAAAWLAMEAQNAVLQGWSIRDLLGLRTKLLVGASAVVAVAVAATALSGKVALAGTPVAVVWAIVWCTLLASEWHSRRDWVPVLNHVRAAVRHTRQKSLVLNG
jgi:O-antigen/teichoic acid export membrane protein